MAIDYRLRRLKIGNLLPPHSIAIIFAATELRRSGDSHYRFCQDSDFYYLTGFEEPDAMLLITAGEHSESILFNRKRIAEHEQWTGPRLGQIDAPLALGVDAAYAYDEIEKRLPEFLSGKEQIFYAMGRYPAQEKCLSRAWQSLSGNTRRGITTPHTWVDLAPLLGEMRVLKEPEEIELMRRAATISIAAHQRLMQSVRHLNYEYELEAEFLYEITRQGCRSTAYDSIVAGGAGACILHYTANNQKLLANDLVLVDAGAEFQHYAADITRTYPINGRFSPEQKQIYELVLRAQRAGIACVKPGTAWDTIQQTIVNILTRGLVDLGLLNGSVDELIASEAYKPFYMHSSGHWLGLDVHDAGTYRHQETWKKLAPGMVLTVEPGLYIKPGLSHVDARWWGIGVRIEDDILVTPNGNDNLTAALPTEVSALEALINGG